jgi:Ca2+-binding RTX toxin-like protein
MVSDGGAGRDRLVGGKGRDTANGGAGADTCSAETKVNC